MEYKIVSISEFKGKTLQIDFDGHEPVFVSAEVVYDSGLKTGMVLTDDDIVMLIRRNDYRRARERALYLLDERDYGYAEMFKKLEKNYSEEICYEVVNNLARLGLIDDRKYAKKCAEYYIERKLYGEYRAREEMRRRGIPKDIIEEALLEYEGSSVETIKELIARKYMRRLSEENGDKKVKAALARQGFSYDDINTALREVETEYQDFKGE